MKSSKTKRWLTLPFCAIALGAATLLTGCQSSIGGQTTPSAYYLKDDIQYFPKGPEFKLFREANALQEARVKEMSRGR